ncbi:MAG TPA: hypothetical protein VGV59_03280 [Pyrinomonadaceae bacterium]|nr:hypothetical protein [Pyrinomonadaceae bacterium]
MNTEHLYRKLGRLSACFAAVVTVLMLVVGVVHAQTPEPEPYATSPTVEPLVSPSVEDETSVGPAPSPTPTSTSTADCERTVKADVVALDQVIVYNRLGAINPSGMMYALKQDVVASDPSKGLTPGNVQLRADKRPRPLALRLNAGDCLQINFTNLLGTTPADDNQPATRTAGVHVMGMELVGSIASDASNVGKNTSSLVAPGGSATYTYYATREGNNLMYNPASTTGGEGNGGSLAMGLFGSVNVEPKGAEWYRSQVTAAELDLATKKNADGTKKLTPGGQPVIDYSAVYPAGHARAGQPILKMTDANLNIVHSDLNAIITGPVNDPVLKGRFPAGTYRPVATSPDRDQPFREFTVVYHDEIKSVQAFEEFSDPVLSHTLYSVKDGFGINYGVAGAGAEVLANRKGVGPMANCTECKFEEFFLSSWAIGDPAQIVDIPANAKDASGNLILGAKATKVLYPEDPSNVNHSYLGDHVKMRVVHAGPKEHHIHHLHAHQWLQTPDDDNSSYLDSQAFGPGYAFTTEIAHGGTGNRNGTVGDSIYHCHFYPHFAQGMWALWRAHDVFEAGTKLDGEGRPVVGARALPDGEIALGTPIPAIVPMPSKAMAPMPTEAVPGYPFYTPAVAGHRPPTPPLDIVDDGGLPRHIITGGEAHSVQTRLDFSKELLTAVAQEIPEQGTALEVAAMNYHAQRNHASFTPDGTPANFVLNGLPAKPGAPFADPCVDNNGNAVGNPRTYKGAAIQLDLKFNKAGWHFPQSRILTLWEDVAPTLAGTRAPEPFFFRANTNDCITFYHTNLTPHVYEQDDFQIRTPTDIMGQHIHLVKFDVTSSDGAGNGFNYEDGTMAPGEVIERIHAINAAGGIKKTDGTQAHLEPKEHPYFNTLGARTTVQRWFADNTLNNNGIDRTLRTVFTHDHYGPSTHQQAGLYGGLVMEPQGSKWRNPETGVMLGTRADGGPTSWRADIIPTDTVKSYREFLLEFADYTLAYQAGAGIDAAGNPIADPLGAINPPVKNEVGLPFIVERALECPGGVPAPCPEAISAADPGTGVVNYRNEPLPLRVRDPQTNTQAAGLAGDLSHVYRSNILRADPAFNTQPGFYPALTGGVKPGDPYTPLMRVYENDRVQVRVLVGAHEEGHNFTISDHKWKHQPGTPDDLTVLNNSGNRASQMMGISEHFEFFVGKMNAINGKELEFADYIYKPSASTDGQWNGIWGIMRAYNGNLGLQPDLLPLPSNTKGKAKKTENWKEIAEVCPVAAPVRNLSVTAVSAAALPGGTLVYNNRPGNGGQLHDPTAIMYFRTSDIDAATGKVKAGVPIEPLVLRANAGECLNVTLTNRLPAVLPDAPGFNTMPMIIDRFNANQVKASNHVGLNPQMLWYDVTKSDGQNIGFNPVQTVAPGQSITYKWYAGDSDIDGIKKDTRVLTPAEFGATALISSDPIKHASKGAIGALIIEPSNATWVEDANTRAQATITKADGTSFREFVVQLQNDVNLQFEDGSPVPNVANEEDSEDSGGKAINYRTEPLWKRMGYAPNAPLSAGEGGADDGDGSSFSTRQVDFTNAFSNSQVGGDPVTPVFTAKAGQQVRFRVLMSGGHGRSNVFQVHGHFWDEEPYKDDSQTIGRNPLSEVKGSQYGVGPTSHFDIVPHNGAGGTFRVAGDYMYRTQTSFVFDAGMWGIFRVTP